MRNDFEDQLRPIWLDAHAGDEAAYRRALALIADRLRGWMGEGCDVYAYFNNDQKAAAWTDACLLAEALDSTGHHLPLPR